MDTNRFTKQQFDLTDYNNKLAHKNGRRIIEPVEGFDVRAMVDTKGRYYLYFWTTCPGTLPDIHKLDSLSQKGEKVMIISLRNNYELIDMILSKTHFSQYPFYTIEADRYTNILLIRKIKFIKEACATCYNQYKDDLAVADYVLVDSGVITPIMFNEKSGVNVLSQ